MLNTTSITAVTMHTVTCGRCQQPFGDPEDGFEGRVGAFYTAVEAARLAIDEGWSHYSDGALLCVDCYVDEDCDHTYPDSWETCPCGCNPTQPALDTSDSERVLAAFVADSEDAFHECPCVQRTCTECGYIDYEPDQPQIRAKQQLNAV